MSDAAALPSLGGGLMPAFIALGLLAAGFGGVLLHATRHREGGRGTPLSLLAFSALGCGGCLLIYPLFSFASMLLIGAGVVAYCRSASGC